MKSVISFLTVVLLSFFMFSLNDVDTVKEDVLLETTNEVHFESFKCKRKIIVDENTVNEVI